MDSTDLKCLPDWFSIVNWGGIQGLWWGLRGWGLAASHCCLSRADMGPQTPPRTSWEF